MGSVRDLTRFQQCKNCENWSRFDEVTWSLKVGTFFETRCRYVTENVAESQKFRYTLTLIVFRLCL